MHVSFLSVYQSVTDSETFCALLFFFFCCCSVAQTCPLPPHGLSTPGFPVLHHLLELAQTPVLQVSDAIQPSHPLSSSSPLALNPSSIRVFSNK